MKKTIYLLRHGHTSLTGTYIGSTDCPLSQKGVKQIERHFKNNSFSDLEEVYCSPMLRCRQTAEILNLDHTISFEPLIREIDFGLWEGLGFSEVYQSYPEQCKSWFEKPSDFSFPGGETVTAFTDRMVQFVFKLKKCKSEKILVIAHGGVIRNLICGLLGLPYENFNLFQIDVGTYAVVELYDESGVLTQLNRSG